MFYKDLYTVLGRLFYQLAAADGKVQPAEKKILHELIVSRWKSLENSADEYGTDLSNIIEFSFDFEDSEIDEESGLQSFEGFYKLNREQFTPVISKQIVETVAAIADAYRGKNKEERVFMKRLEILLRQTAE